MENKIAKIETNQEELSTIDEMIAGCDSAVVTYGVDQDYNVHKVVTLFCRTSGTIYQFEQFAAEHSNTLTMNPKMALSKSMDFKIDGKKVKKYTTRDYFKRLYRTLIGFIKDKETKDLRYEYEQKPTMN